MNYDTYQISNLLRPFWTPFEKYQNLWGNIQKHRDALRYYEVIGISLLIGTKEG